MNEEQKQYYMQEAILEAKKAGAKGEVPIGAVVVVEGKMIGRGHNVREETQDATTHAEMMAIREANRTLSNWRLEDASIFVTLEPCPMCSGAIILSRIANVYYGASDPKAGVAGTLMNLLTDERFNHQATVERGICEDECRAVLKDFFRDLRKKRKEENRKHLRKSIQE